MAQLAITFHLCAILGFLILTSSAGPITPGFNQLAHRDVVTLTTIVTVSVTGMKLPVPTSNRNVQNQTAIHRRPERHHGKNHHHHKPKHPSHKSPKQRNHGLPVAATETSTATPTNTNPSSSPSSSSPPSQNPPFDHIIAFGDNLSDNGNGSFAHDRVCSYNPNSHKKRCSQTIYGFRTWTDGPVAVSYLSTLLSAPLTYDFAFGHASGGSKFGATIKNSYTKSPAGAPDAFEQLANYTASPYASNASSALHFIWIGNNDINLYHMWPSTPADQGSNVQFAKDMADMMEDLVRGFVQAGAKNLFVPTLYPKHISPSKEFYADNAADWANMGTIIANANDAIASRLEDVAQDVANQGVKVVTYDVFGYMMQLWDNHAEYGIEHVGGEFCDGYSQEDWDLCVTDGKGDSFYWMQYLDMTTAVHEMVAKDMAKVISESFG